MFKDTNFLNRIAAKPKPIGVVYFISSRERGYPVKIGRTTNYLAAARLTQLQIGSPYQLEFFAAVEAPAEYERELHDQFAKHALRGEWFRRAPEIMALVDKLQRENRDWRKLLKAPKAAELASALPL